MTRRAPLLFALLVGLLLASCDTAAPGEGSSPPPRPLTQQEEQLVTSNASLGMKLFRTVSRAEPEQNVILSPLSVSMALGMTLNGAEGETRAAMEETLELTGLSQKEINASYRSLIDLLNGLDPNVSFSLANSIWYRQGFHVEPAFIEVNKTYFDAAVRALDFGSPEAPGLINDWVREKTEGKIEKIVKSIPSTTVMYLINALYFKGTWRYAFDPEETTPAPFTLPDGSEVTVDLMTLPEPTLPYYADDKVTAVDLPYGDSLYSMTILFPRQGRNVDSLVAQLDAARWEELLAGLRPNELGALQMPRFELRYKKTLNEVLKALGMEVAFDPGRANFDAINPKQKDLYIDKVLHKTFIEVNEEGTEAAAVTSVSIGLTSAGPSTLRIDRPFVFILRENHSGTILFIGKVTNPTV